MNKLVLACIALGLVGAAYGQTTANSASTRSATGLRSPSLGDNPGVLGNTFADLNYTWIDFHRDRDIDADGFIAGLKGNANLARGFDGSLGYNYYRENGHRNPFNGSAFDARYHQLMSTGTFYAPGRNVKPFVSGSLGYQWSHGDFQRLRTYDSQWVWGASGGVEMGLGAVTVTPRISYSDSFENDARRTWHYGAEVHHWFTERTGGYLDATFHDPRAYNGFAAPESWTYTAGLRVKF